MYRRQAGGMPGWPVVIFIAYGDRGVALAPHRGARYSARFDAVRRPRSDCRLPARSLAAGAGRQRRWSGELAGAPVPGNVGPRVPET